MSDTPNFMTHERIMTGEEYVSYADYLTLQPECDEERENLRITQQAWLEAKKERVKAIRERNEAREQNAKLREMAERAIDDLGWFYETEANKLHAELDQLKEGTK